MRDTVTASHLEAGMRPRRAVGPDTLDHRGATARRGRGGDDRRNGNRRPGENGPQIPEIDEIMRKGQEQLRVLMGGRGRQNGGPRGPNRGPQRLGYAGLSPVCHLG